MTEQHPQPEQREIAPHDAVVPTQHDVPRPLSTTAELEDVAERFYRDVLAVLQRAEIPFLVGGGFALVRHTGVERPHKDFDIFVQRRDFERALGALDESGMHTEVTFPHWLGKALRGDAFVDVIFSSGNGVCPVDEGWFSHAIPGQVHGVEVALVGPEEVLWTKAFIMERERFDGADVNHVLLTCAQRLDWEHLLDRFSDHWRVLLAHLVLFGFAFPSERARIPAWVIDTLLGRLHTEESTMPPFERLCRGTLLSRAQYLEDLSERGYGDGREIPYGRMSAREIAHWTAAIER
jgi:hypothetical protein